ncbi:hypothetical protein L3556_07845 [Candidatus Synechococcus calcipolaris G9]|uniref:Glycine zipper domain-containing protein n=1 Tax=Candidatus Synechococcus calcipolaris G9 TaxID=1497997 RepID=A0ABT6EYF0_9SYNE|nr:hypothetical protein [Candidatus Synechococcus calcipolaris]MDG2990840.1 hypothetical protein [Candidatus Synechococcus calcipolaris G9]
MSQHEDLFKLQWPEYLVMSSFQYYLTKKDVDREEAQDTRLLKREWLRKWKVEIERFVSESAGKKLELLEDEELFNFSKNLLEPKSKLIDRVTILTELVVFTPYFSLEIKKSSDEDKYKDLKPNRGGWFDEDHWLKAISSIAFYLGLRSGSPQRIKTYFEEAVKKIKSDGNIFIWVLVGIILFALLAPLAIPAIVGLLAPAGLYGAAATSSVLAALGGGALAAGGFGMAGGFVVVVGGGALLGGVTGGVLGNLLKESPDMVVLYGAKLIATIREIEAYDEKVAYALGESVVMGLTKSLRSLEDQVNEEYISQKGDTEKRDNILKSIEYFRKVIKTIQDFLRDIYHLIGSNGDYSSLLLEYTGSHRQIYSPPQLPPSNVSDVESYRFSPVCSNCYHLNDQNIEGVKRTCKAFLQGIPDDIWQGYNLHQNPYPGDNGIQFQNKYS